MCLLHGLRRWSVAVKGKSFFGKRTVVFAREEESKGIGARGTDRREGGTEEKGKAGGIDTFRTENDCCSFFVVFPNYLHDLTAPKRDTHPCSKQSRPYL